MKSNNLRLSYWRCRSNSRWWTVPNFQPSNRYSWAADCSISN